MKKLGIYFMMLAMMAFSFVACSDDDPKDPTITIASGSDSIAIDLADPINWEVPVTVTSPDEDMYSISVYIIGADEQKYPVAVIAAGAGLTDPRAWEHTYKPTDADLGAVMFLLNEMQVKPVSFNVDVNIVNKPTFSASKPFSIKGTPVVVDTPLSDPAAFSWERVGGGAATGNFSTFGLKWVQNGAKANFVYIERDKADKFVQFTAAQWAQITTKEVLKAAVDSELAPNMDRFKGVSADATKDYDYVLATKYGDNYYLIHITKGTVSTVSAGTKIVIDGQSKN